MTQHTDETLLAANIAFIEELSHRPVTPAVKQYMENKLMSVLIEGISLTVPDDNPMWLKLIGEYKDKLPSFDDSPNARDALSRLSWQMGELADREAEKLYVG
jgi:hypothetical protein